VAGERALGDGTRAERVEDELGQVEPRESAEVGIVREELVGGVDTQDADAGELTHTRGADARVQRRFSNDSAFVAVAERRRDRSAVGREADVVHAPAVDGDGADAFGGDGGTLAQAFMQAGEDAVEAPVEAVGGFDGGVGEAVDELDVRLAA
jgi:hypothetical protein